MIEVFLPFGHHVLLILLHSSDKGDHDNIRSPVQQHPPPAAGRHRRSRGIISGQSNRRTICLASVEMVSLSGATASRGARRWPLLQSVAEAGKGREPELAATPSSPRPPEQLCAGLLWPESQDIAFPLDRTTWGQLRMAKGGITVLTTLLYPSCFLGEVGRYLALKQPRVQLSWGPWEPGPFTSQAVGVTVWCLSSASGITALNCN